MRPRQYRISDDDYNDAMAEAAAREVDLSAEVRDFVIRYGKPQRKGKGKR